MTARRIRKILVANRGEIAVRVMRTCQEMGISTVGVYSDADKLAPHVRNADEAYRIGPPPAIESYLDQVKTIEIAKRSGADAIHPGYGFLSENHEFARRVSEAGLTFIGPTHESMKLLGDKTEARKLARNLSIPMTEGTTSAVQSLAELEEVSQRIGYPVLLKAAGGGGGKGMKIVESISDLSSKFASARSEAASAFGDDRVYVEKYIRNPRHIEVQVLADTQGNVIHLGERECSIQRRHQKIVEESPSVAVQPSLRESMTNDAKRLVKSAGYVNAATVEFLLDEGGKYYFLEVNARLQVEHPVTEMRTGIDIVREQIGIAEGHPLSLTQEEVEFKGAAIECRVYAEDPENAFLPSIGVVRHIESAHGPFIREDLGIDLGFEITPYYDPLLSKIIAWGRNREEALARIERALSGYELLGVSSNLALCAWIVKHEKFRNGGFSTSFLEENFQAGKSLPLPHDLEQAAAIIACLMNAEANHHAAPDPVPNGKEGWKAQRVRSW